jgi:hypothetical protein
MDEKFTLGNLQAVIAPDLPHIYSMMETYFEPQTSPNKQLVILVEAALQEK